MKYLFADGEKGINWRVLKRFDVLLPTFFHNLTMQKPSWLWQRLQSFYVGLLGEERPRPMLMWLMVLVVLLHVLLAQRLLKPLEPLTLATPLMMEVALMAAAAPEVSETVTKPVSEPKPQPPKPKPLKPVKKKPKPVVQKPVEVPKISTARPVKMPAAAEPEAETETSEPVAVATPDKALVAKAGTAPNKAETFTEANFQANYGYNPKPIYPSIARKQHWEGRVTLSVQVSAEGTSDSVRVYRSSGHDELDESAMEAVRKWRFIPAKRGSTAVSTSVLVPIIFTLYY